MMGYVPLPRSWFPSDEEYRRYLLSAWAKAPFKTRRTKRFLAQENPPESLSQEQA